MEDQMRGQPVGDAQRNMLRNQTWNQMVNDIIFNNIYEKLGLTVTAAELNELVTGENASPYIKQQFRNQQTGQFDPAQVKMFLSNLDRDPEGAEPGTTRKQWLKFEGNLKENQYQEKYNALINKGLYVPTWLAEVAYNDQARTVDFKYVQLPYSEINDADVKVSDDDLKKYIADHAAKFKQEEETRKVDYVAFDIAASSGDSVATMRSLEEKREEFAKGEKASDDSLFVKIYSETPFDDVYYEKDKLFSPIKDSLFSAKVKTIIGPYADGKMFKLAKITDRKLISDSVKVRDIKIGFAGVTTQEAANAKFMLVDSIFKQIDSLKGDFGKFAAAFSDDEVSKTKGGDIGWVKAGEKDKAINDLIFFRAQKGKLYKVPSQTENAIHLVEVVEDKPTKLAVQVAYFTKEIVPSPETEKNIYSTATSFAADNQNTAKFKSAGEKLHIKTVPALKKDAYDLDGLQAPARDVVKWAFKANKGEVSPVYTVDKKHIVALVEDIRPKGLPDLDAVRDGVKAEVIKNKKFELLAKKITDAKAASIDDLATKLGKTATEAQRASFGSPNVNGSYEPKVVATALTSPVAKVSQPVQGNAGAYVVQTTAVAEPPKASDYGMYSFQIKQKLMGKSRDAQEVEKKLANIDDNRFDFF